MCMNQTNVTKTKTAKLALYPLYTKVTVAAKENVFGETEYELVHESGRKVKHVDRHSLKEFVEALTSGLNPKAKLL
jgi:hypothetical protein